MKSFRLLYSLSLVVLNPSLVFGAAQCPGNVAPIQYHALNDSQVTVPVTINGSGPYEFMVDTGAQITAVDPSLAAELGLKPERRIDVLSLTQSDKVDLAAAGSMQVGTSVVRNGLLLVQNLEQVQAIFPHVRGILGQTFLTHFDLFIDRRRRILCMDDTGTLQHEINGERVPLLQVAHDNDLPFTQPVLVSARVTGNGPGNTILRLDSGSNVALLYANHLAAPPWIQMKHAIKCADAGHSVVYLMSTESRDVQFGKQLLRSVDFSTPVDDGSSVKVRGEDGVLPIGLFKNVFISQAGHYVIFNARVQ